MPKINQLTLIEDRETFNFWLHIVPTSENFLPFCIYIVHMEGIYRYFNLRNSLNCECIPACISI